MSAADIFTALRDTLRAAPLSPDADPTGEPLFAAVELWKNRHLGAALQKLATTMGKKRICLVVPTAIHRDVPDPTSGVAIMGRKFAEVSLIFSDVAFFAPEQNVTFGSDANLGLVTFDERIEAVLTGRALSPFGGIVCGSTSAIVLADSEAKQVAGREAWIMDLIVPLGLICAPVA